MYKYINQSKLSHNFDHFNHLFIAGVFVNATLVLPERSLTCYRLRQYHDPKILQSTEET